MTYKEAYLFGKDKLVSAGILDADCDARYLLEFVCKTDRNTLYMYPDKVLGGQEEKEYQSLIMKRAERIPLQHITHEQEFMGLKFYVDEHVLIPRQDTETLVEEVLRYLHDGMKILDMCTGSGCILLSLLKYSNACEGVGADISSDALKVAKENARCLSLAPKWINSNLFENVEGTFDIIVSNPPYIKTDIIENLEPEVKDHEPFIALDGDADGLKFYRIISKEAKQYLLKGGMLFFEIGHDEKEEVVTIMKEEGYREVTALKDLAGNDRVVFGTF